MAAIAKENGEVDDALAAMRHYVTETGQTPTARYEFAALNAQLGRLDDAEAILKRVPINIPSPAERHYIQGTLAANQGRFAHALAHIRQAVEASPASGQAWLALAMIGKLSDVDETALFAAAAQVAGVSTIDQAAYAYACGKILDGRKDYDQAFSAFAQGAAIMRRERPYAFEKDSQDAANAQSGWREFFERIGTTSPAPENNVQPIFVTGLPRSGTTLVEQILSSHSQVAGGGELGLMHIVSRDVGQSATDYQSFTDRGGSARQLADLYSHLALQRFPGAKRIVDKSLDTSRHMGMITAIFADAPIIWLKRDALDCAWSTFRTWFLRGLNWSWSFEDIGLHFGLEYELMNHWAELNPRILSVEYADLVTNPTYWIECITNHCGLEMEPVQLNSHETVRNVMTASVAQVREIINTRAIGSARPYVNFMRPFIEVFEKGQTGLSAGGSQ